MVYSDCSSSCSAEFPAPANPSFLRYTCGVEFRTLMPIGEDWVEVRLQPPVWAGVTLHGHVCDHL